MASNHGLFVDVACLPQGYVVPSWRRGPTAEWQRYGADGERGTLTVLKFQWGASGHPIESADEAATCIDKLVSLCKQEGWELASMGEIEGCGSLPPRSADGVLFHGRYVCGTYRFDVGSRPEGYMRFRTAADAATALHLPELRMLCGGEAPRLIGEIVCSNELKFGRALTVMGCLYASATGSRVLQLTDPPGELGKDTAPDGLVSEELGTVFVVIEEGPLGLKWRCAGTLAAPPGTGRELTSNVERLAAALQRRREFTRREWEAFEIELHRDDYVKVGDDYFAPVEGPVPAELLASDDNVLACEQTLSGSLVARVTGKAATSAARLMKEAEYAHARARAAHAHLCNLPHAQPMRCS